MNLRKLKRELGDQVQVSRRKQMTTVRAAGLTYRLDEGRFGDERELAEFVRSKLPAMSLMRVSER